MAYTVGQKTSAPARVGSRQAVAPVAGLVVPNAKAVVPQALAGSVAPQRVAEVAFKVLYSGCLLSRCWPPRKRATYDVYWQIVLNVELHPEVYPRVSRPEDERVLQRFW